VFDTGRSPYSIARPLHAVSAFIQYTRHVVWRAWVLLPYGCIMLTLSRVSLSEHRFTPICLSVPPLYRPIIVPGELLRRAFENHDTAGCFFSVSQSINQSNKQCIYMAPLKVLRGVCYESTFKKP